MADDEGVFDDREESPAFSQWEFIDRIPTREEVLQLLGTLPDWWGVPYVDLAEYVQGLPSTKKQKVTVTNNGRTRKEERLYEVVTLYMGVAGRLQMLNRAAELHGWEVEFQPEPRTPTGVPGFLQMDDRLVYREYLVIKSREDEDSLGMKPGMAWVPYTGGRQAAGSNPYEKVETAARGRAMAAWGIGVLPGSGVASLEEMLGAREPARVTQAEEPRMSRADMLGNVVTIAEEIRQLRQYTPEQQQQKLKEYLKSSFGIEMPEEGEVDWSKVKDGQVRLTLTALQQSLNSLRDQAAPV